MRIMVFDIGGTEVKHSIMDESLVPASQGSFKTPKATVKDAKEGEPLDGDFWNFIGLLEKVYRPHESQVEGIAISMPGFIDSRKGRQCGGGAIPYLVRRDFASALSERCSCPVRIDNDGKCAALAEKRIGSLKGCRNAAVFIIGTGVGGGLIINDRILNGEHFTAGEFSFVRVNMDGDWNDKYNTMGFSCSTVGLLNIYKKEKGLPEETEISGRDFFEKYGAGESEALASLPIFCRRVAVAIQNINFFMDLEKVAIGGGISRQPSLIQGIQKAIDELSDDTCEIYDPNIPKAVIVPCAFLNEANQIGAYYLFSEELD